MSSPRSEKQANYKRLDFEVMSPDKPVKKKKVVKEKRKKSKTEATIQLVYSEEENIAGFHGAILQDDASQVLKWMNVGMSVECHDANGRTPLYNALCNKSYNVVKLLLAASADVSAKNTDGDSTYRLSKTMMDGDLNGEGEALCRRIQESMRLKQVNLINRWKRMKEMVSLVAADQSPREQLMKDIIKAKFELRRAEVLEEAEYLGTDRMKALKNEVVNFQPFSVAAPVEPTFKMPYPVQRRFFPHIEKPAPEIDPPQNVFSLHKKV